MGNNLTKKQFADKLFEKYDTNKNNSIDKEEIKIFVRKLLNDSGYFNISDYTIDVYIKKWDKDGNGKLSRNEVRPILENAWEEKYKK